MKKIVAILLLLAVIFSSAFVFYNYLLKDRRERKVSIIRDVYGIPHIYGESDKDVMYGFGYAQAEDHLLDMILNYLTATGRLSEFYGENYIRGDFLVHLLRIPEEASKYREQLSSEVVELIEEFCKGVNAYIEKHQNKLPPELQSYRVSVKDVVAWCYYIQLSRSIGDVVKELNVTVSYSPAVFCEISNEWAIAYWKTSLNANILLGDPHLPWYGMHRWYEAHLVGDKLNVYGATFYGVPFIIIGFNNKIAWTFTRNNVDLGDVFVEKLNPNNPKKYLLGKEWRSFEEKLIKIKVMTQSGYKYFMQKAYYSIHGPVIYVDFHNYRAYTISLEGYGVITMIEQFYRMNTAQDLKEFINALRLRGVVLWNILYADVYGNIYYIYNARIHMKSEKYDPEKPRPGWELDAQWSELYPFEKLPAILNPKSGFIQNNNVAPWNTTLDHGLNPEDYPRYLVGNRGSNDRGVRAFEVLKKAYNFTLSDALSLATDTYIMKAEKYVPLILNASKGKELSPDVKKALKILSEWDYRADVDSEAMTIFYCWWMRYRGKGDPWKAFEETVSFMKIAYGKIEVKWGEVHIAERGGFTVPLAGGVKELPALWMASGPIKGNRIICNSGSSFTMLVVLKKDNITAYTLLPYGESEDPSSPHYRDQLILKGKSRLKKVFFYLEEVEKNSETKIVLNIKG